MNCYHTSIQMCSQYCILAPAFFLSTLKFLNIGSVNHSFTEAQLFRTELK